MKKHFFSLSLILGLVFGMACFTSEKTFLFSQPYFRLSIRNGVFHIM